MLFSPRPREGIRRTWLLQWGLLFCVAFLSLYLAFQIRFEFHIPREPTDWTVRMWESMAWVLPLELVILFATGQFSPLVARFRFRDFLRSLLSVGIVSAFLFYMWFMFEGAVPPRSVIVLNGILLLLGLLGIGSVSAHLRSIVTGKLSDLPARSSRILAVGEGFLAHQLIRKTRQRPGLAMRVVGLVTTNGACGESGLWQSVPIAGSLEQIEPICRRFDPDSLVVTDPRLSADRLRELVAACRRLHVPVSIVPTAQEMFYGVLRIEGSQEVRVNFEIRELLVSGYVRPGDISRNNEITYDKIASARISYGGRGQITDVQQPRVGQQVLDAILPF